MLESAMQPSWFAGILSDYILPYGRFEPGQLQNSTVYTQYQKLKKEWKNNVYLARSRIQGLGLYAAKNLEMNSMIIEYKGELIRSEVSLNLIANNMFFRFRLASVFRVIL